MTSSPGEPCKNFILDEDGESTGRPCGDEGERCEACEKEEEDYWFSQFRKTPLSESDPEKYREEMKDAGRGHLLPPEDM